MKIKSFKTLALSSIIISSLLLSGCDNDPKIYGEKISKVDSMSRIEMNKAINADEVYALYYIKETVKEPIDDKTVGEVIKIFEKNTKTKVIKGNVDKFTDYKVRDLNIESAARQINQQATKEEITKIRKYVENVVRTGNPEQKEKMLNMTLGEIIKQ